MIVSFVGRQTVRRGKGYTFSVTYAAPGDAVRPDTAGDDDLLVTGPGGFSAPAKLVGARLRANRSVLMVRYRVAAPGGRFDASDNGSYCIAVADGAVTTVGGRSAGAVPAAFGVGTPSGNGTDSGRLIGNFTVDARARRRKPAPPSPAAAPALPAPPSPRRSDRHEAEELAGLLE